MSFRYKKHSNRINEPWDLNRLEQVGTGDDPPLTTYVNGIGASDIEERFARALDKNKIEYMFQINIPTAFSLPDEDKIVDFLLPDLMCAIEVDGEIGHGTSAQQAKDAVRDAHLNPILSSMGYGKLQHIKWYDLETQELADLMAQDLL